MTWRAQSPEHFVVEEIPAYAPSGAGDHTFLWIEKRGLTTAEAIAALASALGAREADAGYAGLKDRVAIARQWISLAGVDPERAAAVKLPGVRVLGAARHAHRLRTGHLRGNRFVVTEIDAGPRVAELAARLAAIVAGGLANRYGGQRFARDNVARARAWLGGGAAPRDRRDRRMVVSALQAHAFNAVLDARAERGLPLRDPIEGDWCERGIPTGPMPGFRMPRPTEGSPARVLEDEVLAREAVSLDAFRGVGRIGRGARRPLVVVVESATVERDGEHARLCFALPSGSYATVLLEALGLGS
ncbi:MAG: tRNA pseudouridine(13) synthase TruD [Myxococcota bacterium]